MFFAKYFAFFVVYRINHKDHKARHTKEEKRNAEQSDTVQGSDTTRAELIKNACNKKILYNLPNNLLLFLLRRGGEIEGA